MRIGQARELLFDPRYLLHRIDHEGGRLIFLPTTRRLLARASFLDGRTRIASGPEIACSIADALRGADVSVGGSRDRFIFHVSFCGSTRLARILDRPGRTLAMREPNVLVDLADWKAALDQRFASDPRLASLVRLACASLRSRWQPDEAVVVKPSNWVNNLIPELASASPGLRPLFVVISRRAFLRAVFRGGRERLAYTARAAAHLAAGRPSDRALLNAAISASSDPLGKVAHIAAFAHWLQHRQFRSAMDAGGWGSDHVVTFDQIESAPRAAASTAAAALDLALTADDLAEGVGRTSERNAKQPDAAYSREERFEADLKVDRVHGGHIEAALAWARDLLVEGGSPADEDLIVRQAG
jgi:hypothetical protein